MDTLDLAPSIELLDDSIDGLEDALKPILSTPLTENAGKLPLLDKAQLYVLVTYAIESIIFSYLRLNGTDAKEHPVFRELTRVKQYFEKIRAAETVGDKKTPNAQLDKAAANRFIKHALGGNVKHEERSAKELEKRKLELEQRLARGAAQDPQDRSLAEQSKERVLTAKIKAEAMAKKGKSAVVSDTEFEESEDSSSYEESESGPVTTTDELNSASPVKGSEPGEKGSKKVLKESKRARV